MIYSNLVACNIDAEDTRFRKKRINLSSNAFAYENDKVMLVFDETSMYILKFEENKIDTHVLNLKLALHSLSYKSNDSAAIYFKYTDVESRAVVLEFKTENFEEDSKKVGQFLKQAAVILEKQQKRQVTSFITSLIGTGLIVGLYFIYLTIAPKTFPQLENYHFMQTAPIMISLVSTFVLIKSYIEKVISFHTVFFYSTYAFLISLGQAAHFQYLSSQNIPNVWNYYALFLVVLFAPIAVSVVLLLKRKTLQQYRTKVPSQLFEASIILTIVAVVLAICTVVVPQTSLNVPITDYRFFSNGIVVFGIIVSVLLVLLLKKESKYTRIILPTLLTVLAFSLAFASSLNSANAYKSESKNVMYNGNYEKVKSVWHIENKDGILIEQDEYTSIIDGYKFKEFSEADKMKLLEIKRVDDKKYKMTVSYYGIVTDEFWEKDDKDKTLKYVSPVAKELPDDVSNSRDQKIIIKKAGTFEDVFSKHFSKKLGENTLTIETSFFVYRQEKGVPYITLRDKENNVIIGGVHYDSRHSKKENKIIGWTRQSGDSNTYSKYIFNDDGTYEKKTVELNQIELDLTKPEKSRGVLTAEQARLYKSHPSYEKQGRFHMVEVYVYDEKGEKERYRLYFNDSNEYITLIQRCLATDQYLYINTESGRDYVYKQYDEHFNETNSKFNLLKTDREVYWEGKWYFTTYNPTQEGFKLYDENGDVVE